MSVRRILRVGSSAGVLGLGSILISAATFISVPIILSTVGADVWVSITIGQVVGEIARVLVVWGWNSVGLTIVGAMTGSARLQYYFASLLPRLLMLLPVAALAALAVHVVPNADPAAATRMALVGAIYGLNGGWFFVANDQPGRYVMLDAIPRAASMLIASLMLLAVPSADVFGWVNILGSIIAVAAPFFIASAVARREHVKRAFGTLQEAGAALRRGAPIMGSVLIMVARISFPVLAAPFLLPAVVAQVALGDKFFRWANTGMTPIMHTLLVRIPRGSSSVSARARRGLIVAWVGGGAIGLATIFVVTLLAPVIGQGEVAIGSSTAVPIGIAVMMVFVATIGGNSVLVMLDRFNQVLIAGAIALVVLVVAAIILTPTWGAPGMFWALAASESAVVFVQTIAIARAMKRLTVQTGEV